jgi:hypothetical protein
MKNQVIGLIVLIITLIGVTWWIRGMDKDSEWIQKYKDAPADTVWLKPDTVWIEVPDESGTVEAEHWQDGVNELQAANDILKMRQDSIQMILVRLLEPKKLHVKSETLGEFTATFFPLGDSVQWHHDPPPERVIIREKEVTKTVVVEKGRPWYEIPAAVVVGGLAVFGLSQLRK